MITTKRSTEYGSAVTENVSFSAGVDLLERKTPNNYNEYLNKPSVNQESYEEAKERMQKNLDKLMNYDRYAEVAEAEVQTEEAVLEISSVKEDDIRPTSTTMQFGDDNYDNIMQDMNRAHEVQASTKHAVHSKSKILTFLYALTIAVIFALIIINTGVLSSISKDNTASALELNGKAEQLRELNERIEDISSIEHIENVAKNEYNMILK